MGEADSSSQETTDVAPRRNPLWTAKSLLLAVVISLVGLAFWIRSPGPSPTKPPASGSGRPATASSFGASESRTAPPPPSGTEAVREKLRSAPIGLRYGVSYIGGFLIGYAYRRSLKVAMWLAALTATGIGVLKWSGAFDLDWNAVQGQVQEGLGWATQQAEVWRHRLSGFLPSAGVGLGGIFMGARRGK